LDFLDVNRKLPERQHDHEIVDLLGGKGSDDLGTATEVVGVQPECGLDDAVEHDGELHAAARVLVVRRGEVIEDPRAIRLQLDVDRWKAGGTGPGPRRCNLVAAVEMREPRKSAQ
jgi:hypothetical protein